MSWIENMINTGRAVQFIISAANAPIGSVYFRDIDHVNYKAEFGIFIGEDNMRNSGLGTTACKLACEYGFKTLGLHKIFLRAFASNTIAIRSYEKSGFVREAMLRDDVFVNGEYRDIILMAKINDML